ncbi:Hydroxyethylthiazole kinase family-domain-containing protein [Phaeosphaeriaceae sp. PMI808]|nr:Hydroxyethylthiazole kinase family-domain-containing protein [Phaeosphaeriaceae sp. PMI808]
MKDQVDYSLYLVTDSTEAILGSRDLVHVVEQALAGAHNVPLLINDRVDVALAVRCEGVHLGQDDMNIAEARRILGEDAIIGATVSSTEEARVAVEQGADYLGIGTLYATNTKNTKSIIGINGIRKILQYLNTADESSQKVKTVCIGGVNLSNTQRLIYQLHAPSSPSAAPKSIDGIAVVSAIVGAIDPKEASVHFRQLLRALPPWEVHHARPHFWLEKEEDEIAHILSCAQKATKAVQDTRPISHNMTNLVVQNFAANVALCIGASPIMANYGEEATDLASLGGALVINTGTVTPDGILNYKKAIKAYNLVGGPIILDPVGAGATKVRKQALHDLMNTSYFDVIKGNEREVLAVAQASGFTLSATTQQRGVDSGDALYSLDQRAYLVSRIALRERNVVLMTGATDVVSDGVRTYAVSNGHAFLGVITGSGCALGTTLSAYVAANPADKLMAVLAGLLHYEVAAEIAGERKYPGFKGGPGTFVPAFLDELYETGARVAAGGKVYCVDGEGVGDTSGEQGVLVKIKCLKDIPDAGLLQGQIS